MGEILKLNNSAIDITPDIKKSWQEISDLLADILEVKAALIMKADFSEDEISVLIKSSNEDNPYKKGESDPLNNSGLYCAYVLHKRDKLHVRNALEDERWKDNPDVARNMISYVGYPIKSPAGDLFGTLCVLDSKEIKLTGKKDKLLQKFRDHIELDLISHDRYRVERKLINEKSLLMREANHRLKNNMSTIYGLLYLQAESTENELAREALNDAARRVKSMSLLHDKLSRNRSNDDVNVKDYITILVEDVRKFYSGVKNIQTNIESDELWINPKTVSALGIIINELMVNSVKHGFRDTESGEIHLSTKKVDDSIKLTYHDSGEGAKSGNNTESQTFGLQLIEQLTSQLNGTLTRKKNPGMKTEIVFPL